MANPFAQFVEPEAPSENPFAKFVEHQKSNPFAQFVEAPQTSTASPVQPGDINYGAGKAQDLQTTTRVEGRTAVAPLSVAAASLGQEVQMKKEDDGTGLFTDVLPRPTGRLGALLRTGSGLEKGIAGGLTGAAELVEGVANYLSSPQGIIETGLAKTPVAPAVYLKWAKDMVEGGMIESGEALDALRRGDMEALGKHAVSGLGMLLGGAAATKQAVGSVSGAVKAFTPSDARIAEANAKALEASLPPDLTALAPLTAAETIKTVEDTNAIRQQGTSQEMLRDQAAQSQEQVELQEVVGRNAQSEVVTEAQTQIAPQTPITPSSEPRAAVAAEPSANAPVSEGQVPPSPVKRIGEVGDLGSLIESKDVEASPRELPPFSIPSKSKLSELQDLPFTEPQREIITKLNELGFNPDVTVVSDPRIPAAAYNGSGGIILNASKLRENPHLAVRGIVHEAVHDATHSAIRNPANEPTVARLGELMSYAMKTYYRNRTKFGGESAALDHAFKNIDEFVTGAFTSGRVRKVMSQMTISERTGVKPTEAKATVFARFMELVSDILGIRGKRTLLEEVVKSGEELIKSRTKSESPISIDATKLSPIESGLTYSAAKPAEVTAEKSIASDWTSATEEAPARTATPRKTPPESGPEIQELGAGIPIPKFANRKMSELDQVTAQHSGKIQKSMSEAKRAQKEIKREVPSDRRQAAITVWREANGDVPTLQGWAAAAKGKAFRQASIDAQTLTANEIAIARKAGAAFDVLERRGNRFDVLRSHRDNYVPHVWDVKRPGSGFGTGMLKQRFRFSKARTFNTFFEGDQAGFKPKTLAIGKLLPAYIHEMNTVIADRQFVRDMVTGTAKDGSPLAVPRGNVKAVDGPSGQAVLVQPKTVREADTMDYRVMPDQPALSNWTWEGKDTAGKPVFVKADLALHPEAVRRVNSMLGQSAIRQWYRDPVGGTAQIPRAIVRGLDTAQSAMKREMFGLLAPFHQVQEGTHAIGHLVNPFFGLEKVDLGRNPKQADAANHGLMLLPDRASAGTYMEGVGTKASLLSRGIRKIPKAGEAVADVIDGYQDYLFHQYIPALKFKTYEAMVQRNTKLYQPELASGEMTMADVKLTSAEQANAAYGHLNYALLDRNPTIQHFIQIAALAPDFLEARVRFAGQGVKGITSKVGHEQFKAIAILAAAQAGAAAVLSQLLGVPYDEKHPFEVVYNGRRYAMRSVPEDIFALFKDTRQFIYSRVNPLTVRGGVQLATGLNYRGEKVTPLETMEELLAGYIPITARSLPGIRELTETGRNTPISPLEQLSGSLGLRVSRYSPISETYKLAAEWMDSQKIERDRGSYPVSKYQQLRYALEDGDMDRAAQEYAELRKTMSAPKIATGFAESINHPFTKSTASDNKFAKSLTGYDKELYDLAIRKRRDILHSFRLMPKK